MKKIILVFLMFFPISVFAFDFGCAVPSVNTDDCTSTQLFNNNTPNTKSNSVTDTNIINNNNSGTSAAGSSSSGDRAEMEEMIALKTQVLARELNRQYKYLEATVNRFQMQLQKAIAKDNADFQEEYAAAGSESSDKGTEKFDKSKFIANCTGRNQETIVNCFQDRIDELQNYIKADSKKTPNSAASALKDLCKNIKQFTSEDSCSSCSKSDQNCLNELNYSLINKLNDSKKQNQANPSK